MYGAATEQHRCMREILRYLHDFHNFQFPYYTGGITTNKSCRRAGVCVECLDLLREQHTRPATARYSLPLDLPAPLGPFNGPQCGATTRAARSCHGRVGSGPELQSKGQGDRAEKRRST